MGNVVSLVQTSSNPQHWGAIDCLDEVKKVLASGEFQPNKFIVLAINDNSENSDLRYWNAGCNEYDMIAILALFQSLMIRDMTT